MELSLNLQMLVIGTNFYQLNETQKAIPYLIAIDTDHNLLFPPLILQKLFGTRGSVAFPPSRKPSAPLPYSEPEIVTQAKENGWRSLLEEVGFKLSIQEYINDNGFFLNEPEAKNITGVIFIVGGKFQLIPNPFASPKINIPDLSKVIQLPLEVPLFISQGKKILRSFQ